MPGLKVLLVLALPLSLLAQDPSVSGLSRDPAGAKTDAAGRNPEYPLRQFSVFVWPYNGVVTNSDTQMGGISRVYYDSPEGSKMLTLTRNTRTGMQWYQGPNLLELYDQTFSFKPPPPDAPNGTPHTRVVSRIPRARIPLPDNIRRFIVLLFPDRKNRDGTYGAIALPYDNESLKTGMVRLINTTDRHLALQFENRENGPALLVPSNKSRDMDPTRFTQSKHPRVFGYVLGKNDTPRIVHTSKLYLERDKTNFYVFYREGRRVRSMRIGGFDFHATPTPSPDVPNRVPLGDP